ncbi:MAG: hypothetical protein JRH11_12650 [Deltaproteobacteria bacterium]|nr:hypothetical protein [Deltaproteobacteria bacterium]
MFEDLAYLKWAEHHYRSVRVNLAASGIPDLPAAMLPMHAAVDTSGPSGLSDWSHWTATRQIVGDGRAFVDRWVAAHDALSWRAPPFGLYGWIEVAGAVDVRTRVERAYADQGLLVAPGEFFGPDPSAFRIGWTMADDRLDESLALLARVLDL